VVVIGTLASFCKTRRRLGFVCLMSIWIEAYVEYFRIMGIFGDLISLVTREGHLARTWEFGINHENCPLRGEVRLWLNILQLGLRLRTCFIPDAAFVAKTQMFVCLLVLQGEKRKEICVCVHCACQPCLLGRVTLVQDPRIDRESRLDSFQGGKGSMWISLHLHEIGWQGTRRHGMMGGQKRL